MQKTPASGVSSAGRPAAAAAAAGGASSQSMLQAELGKLARLRLREHMASLTLSREELELLWRLLKRHASPPLTSDERINYDDFCQVSEAMPARCSRSFFCASHFAKFFPDSHGRISLLDFFQWARRKNALMETRIELSSFDADADGTLTERELGQWIKALIPNLPALEGIVGGFVEFYRVTAVRKFLFFLGRRQRTRVPIEELLASPVMHELLELKRLDITSDELRHNWFSLAYAEMLYADYLELDEDQNGMLSAQELSRYRGGGLTGVFIERIFQECQTYRNPQTRQSEIDYKSYLDFVLATTYKGTPESLSYFLRLLDIQKVGGLTALDVKIFFRAVVHKFA
jgi:Ca2+-binding EF-hand superfamily protein